MSEKLYEIYEVSYKGQVVYIGSGLQGVRHLHVKSGKSHSVELNKLFFTDPDNVVVILLRDCLTQEESLEIEKEYIQAYELKFNIIHTKRHRVSIINGKKSKPKRTTYRSNGK